MFTPYEKIADMPENVAGEFYELWDWLASGSRYWAEVTEHTPARVVVVEREFPDDGETVVTPQMMLDTLNERLDWFRDHPASWNKCFAADCFLGEFGEAACAGADVMDALFQFTVFDGLRYA